MLSLPGTFKVGPIMVVAWTTMFFECQHYHSVYNCMIPGCIFLQLWCTSVSESNGTHLNMFDNVWSPTFAKRGCSTIFPWVMEWLNISISVLVTSLVELHPRKSKMMLWDLEQRNLPYPDWGTCCLLTLLFWRSNYGYLNLLTWMEWTDILRTEASNDDQNLLQTACLCFL